MNLRIPALALTLTVCSLLLAACGDDDGSPATAAAEPANEAGSTDTAEAAGSNSGEVDLTSKPEVEVPSGKPPKKLEIVDIVEGDGAEAKPGDLVTVDYVGVDFDRGEEFDSSWDRGTPFPFELGEGGVIEGWDEGVAGMKEGGRRMLVIPPDLAYGKGGAPPAIGPDATLVFVIDLLDVS